MKWFGGKIDFSMDNFFFMISKAYKLRMTYLNGVNPILYF